MCLGIAIGLCGCGTTPPSAGPGSGFQASFGTDSGTAKADVVAIHDTAPSHDVSAPADSTALDATEPGSDTGSDTGSDDGSLSVCGDGSCDGSETCDLCPDDCGACGPTCGDGQCDAPEKCSTCPADCGPCGPQCGDKQCTAPTETCSTCPKDCGVCPASCGDGKCGGGENCQTCPDDCGNCPVVCGDQTCDAAGGETCTTCPADCPCASGCGDGKCDKAKETCQSCPADCGTCPGQCSPVTSQPCPADQQCYVGSSAPVCAPPGTGQKGAACTGLADCIKGYLCVNGACAAICDTTGTTPGLACTKPAQCGELSVSGKPIGYGLGACIGGDNCNALTNLGCSSGLMCVPVGGSKGCVSTGKVGENQPCTGSSDCDGGHVCVAESASAPMLCKKRCNATGGSPGCTTGACGGLTIGNPPKSAPDNLGACP
jgi:hypothetical protein